MAIESFSGKYEFLSNFHHQPIVYEKMIFPTVEHAFQAEKARLFNQPIERERISRAKTPGGAKRMGQNVTINVADWNDMRIRIMYKIVLKKFRDDDLGDKLLETGDEELIEGNNHKDKFWGVYKGEGKNWLGKILMEVRAQLREERDRKFYVTTFCNFAHRMSDGMPMDHECYRIPPKLLRAERDLEYEEAMKIWEPWFVNKGDLHRGVKTKDPMARIYKLIEENQE